MRVLAVMSMSALCSFAWAETLPSFLNSNDSVRNLPRPNLPADAYRPARADLQVAPPGSGPAQALLMGTPVRVAKLQIEGGTLYSTRELAASYRPLMGAPTTLGELIEATRSITRRYQDDGYLLSYAFLPQQNFQDGLVRVVLVEGYIRDYQLQGEIGPVSAYLDRLVAKLKAERPLTRKTFERYTGLMSRVPGVTLQAQVPPPGTTDGATTLVASARRKPVTSSLSLQQGSRDETQALIAVNSNAQTAMAEQLSLSGLFPPGEDREHYYRLDYSQYLDADGLQLNLSGARYRAEPKTRVEVGDGRQLRSRSEDERFSLGLSYPLIVSQNESLTLGSRFYGVNSTTAYRGDGFPFALDLETHIRALAFEGEWRKADPRQLRILSAGVYQGFDVLGAKATNGSHDLDFFRLRLSGVQSDKFLDNWQGVLSTALYWSNDNLPQSEGATFGGQNFGRGYPSDQAVGDKGWGLAYEVNYSFNREGNWVKLIQPFVVLDRARTWYNEGSLKGADMSSAALGFRFGDGRYYNIALEAAKPLSDPALDTFNRRPRYTLSFSYQL